MKRVLIFIGLKLWEIFRWIMIGVLWVLPLIVGVYLEVWRTGNRNIPAGLFIVIGLMAECGWFVLIAYIDDVGKIFLKWIKSNWKKAGEIANKK